ncbi:MAG: hypothetical protein AAF585_02450 [Verrucomicrobiota bacterium]
MATELKANITNLDALDSFRSALIRFLEKAKISLDEVGDEVTRTRVWLNSEQSQYWKTEIRKYSRKLEDAQQALFSAELSEMRESSSFEQRQVQAMRSRLRNGEDKLRTVQKYSRNYDAAVEPLGKSVDRLRSFFEHEMPKAMLFLNNAIKALDDYARMNQPTQSGSDPKPPPAAADPGEGESEQQSVETDSNPS